MAVPAKGPLFLFFLGIILGTEEYLKCRVRWFPKDQFR